MWRIPLRLAAISFLCIALSFAFVVAALRTGLDSSPAQTMFYFEMSGQGACVFVETNEQ